MTPIERLQTALNGLGLKAVEARIARSRSCHTVTLSHSSFPSRQSAIRRPDPRHANSSMQWRSTIITWCFRKNGLSSWWRKRASANSRSAIPCSTSTPIPSRPMT